MLRSGGTEALLGHKAMAPSTLGTFLRAFTFGHVRQLDKVLGEAIKRAWAAGAGPGAKRLVIDIDSFLGEAKGRLKEGASRGYTGVRGYHPLLATRAGTGEVLHAWARKGAANSARGALRFCEETHHRPAISACSFSVAGHLRGTAPSLSAAQHTFEPAVFAVHTVAGGDSPIREGESVD